MSVPTSAPPSVSGAVDLSIATSPCDVDSVPGLLRDISSSGAGRDLSADRDARLDLLGKARSLVRALETPRETMLQHCHAMPTLFICIGLGVDTGLFHEMSKDNGSPKTSPELAAALAFDLDPLRRILTHLAATGCIVQTNIDEYKPTNFAKALTIPVINAGYPFYRSVGLIPMLHLHQWMKQNAYKAPTSPHDSAFTLGHRTTKTLFEFVASNPYYGQIFNHHMGGYRLGRPSWVDEAVYSVQKNLIDGFDGDGDGGKGVLLVDVGGNVGHDLTEFLQAFPDAPGRLVLQDQPGVIQSIAENALDARVERMSHDFFGEQPIVGARAYFLHSVLHDWPDDQCVDIVMKIKSAMTPGYSKLIVNEHVIPAVGASWEATSLDMYVMGFLGGRERTEDNWRNLLETRCGLKICGIWNPGNGVEGVMEAEVA